jgi:hypothetical protein
VAVDGAGDTVEGDGDAGTGAGELGEGPGVAVGLVGLLIEPGLLLGLLIEPGLLLGVLIEPGLLVEWLGEPNEPAESPFAVGSLLVVPLLPVGLVPCNVWLVLSLPTAPPPPV